MHFMHHQGGHRLPGLSKSLRLRAPGQGVKESKGSPSLFPILTSGPMRGTVNAQRCPSRRAARGVTGADLPNGAAACCLLPGLVRRPQGDLEKQRGVQLSRAAPKHRELKKQEARVRSRKDPFLMAALITSVAEGSCSLRMGL